MTTFSGDIKQSQVRDANKKKTSFAGHSCSTQDCGYVFIDIKHIIKLFFQLKYSDID